MPPTHLFSYDHISGWRNGWDTWFSDGAARGRHGMVTNVGGAGGTFLGKYISPTVTTIAVGTAFFDIGKHGPFLNLYGADHSTVIAGIGVLRDGRCIVSNATDLIGGIGYGFNAPDYQWIYVDLVVHLENLGGDIWQTVAEGWVNDRLMVKGTLPAVASPPASTVYGGIGMVGLSFFSNVDDTYIDLSGDRYGDILINSDDATYSKDDGASAVRCSQFGVEALIAESGRYTFASHDGKRSVSAR